LRYAALLVIATSWRQDVSLGQALHLIIS